MSLTKQGVDPSRIDRTWEHLGLVYLNYYFVVRVCDYQWSPILEGNIKISNDIIHYCLYTYKAPYKDGEYTQQQEKQNVIDAWDAFKKDCHIRYEQMECGELTVLLTDECNPRDTWFPTTPVINGSYENWPRVFCEKKKKK
jgi:hypothetical protein